jgi:hypothetical protein
MPIPITPERGQLCIAGYVDHDTVTIVTTPVAVIDLVNQAIGEGKPYATASARTASARSRLRAPPNARFLDVPSPH